MTSDGIPSTSRIAGGGAWTRLGARNRQALVGVSAAVAADMVVRCRVAVVLLEVSLEVVSLVVTAEIIRRFASAVMRCCFSASVSERDSLSQE